MLHARIDKYWSKETVELFLSTTQKNQDAASPPPAIRTCEMKPETLYANEGGVSFTHILEHSYTHVEYIRYL